MHRQQGFSYLALLFLVTVLSIVLSITGVVWQTAVQREKERELLFIGEQFRSAIASYYNAMPAASLKRYPAALADLIKDSRFPNVRRHLRRVYVDPMTGKAEWGLVRSADGAIIGIHSLSEQAPIRISFPSGPNKDFAGKKRYLDWKFVYLPVAPKPPFTAPGPVNQLPRVSVSGDKCMAGVCGELHSPAILGKAGA
jgi:type II secretory pathway pseudopilin PulG